MGFVVSGGGLIFTGAQLVDHNGRIAKTVNVVFQVGATQTKRVVGAIVCVDATHDLAVVSVDPAQVGGLVALPMGDSSALRPGQAVVALGDPLIEMNGRVVAVIDRIGATGDPRSAGSAVPINLAAHVIADSVGG